MIFDPTAADMSRIQAAKRLDEEFKAILNPPPPSDAVKPPPPPAPPSKRT